MKPAGVGALLALLLLSLVVGERALAAGLGTLRASGGDQQSVADFADGQTLIVFAHQDDDTWAEVFTDRCKRAQLVNLASVKAQLRPFIKLVDKGRDLTAGNPVSARLERDMPTVNDCPTAPVAL